MKKAVIAVVVIVVLAGAWMGFRALSSRDQTPASEYRTTPIQQGEIVQSITANGTVEPEELVNVGAQVTGQILNFGKDRNGAPINYGSQVEEGMMLARIDDATYKAELEMAKAQVLQAQATLKHDDNDLTDLRAKLKLATSDWDRAKRLRPTEAMTQASYDSYQQAYNSAVANLAKGEASLLQAKGSLAYAQAYLMKAQRNADYCIIRSPVKGVVIDRRVNIGQTVVSSMSTSSLFLIAKDLKRMQVWASVNEADIDRIKVGQPVTFTVDAFPNETFHGEVGKVRLNASQTNNVITYTIEVNTDNTSGRLLPYLTANVSFIVAKHENVLMVPNAALRWSPQPEQLSEADQKLLDRTGKPKNRKQLWLLVNNQLKPAEATVGITNGTFTEVAGDGLKEGEAVIYGIQTADAASNDTVNPFAPKMPKRKR